MLGKGQRFAWKEALVEGATSYKSLRVVAICLLAISGCSLSGRQSVWREPTFLAPAPFNAANHPSVSAEAFYAAGVQAESQGSACCVDYYYQAAVASWPCFERELAATNDPSDRSADLYRSSVTKLLITSQQHGRWRPGRGLRVSTQEGEKILPAQFQGFAWRPEDFQLLAPCGDYSEPSLRRLFRNRGLGIPLVAVRHTNCPQPFTNKIQAFSATALLRPNEGNSGSHLEFYDPLRVSDTIAAGREVPLARDLSAPFAFESQGVDRQWITSYLEPGRASDKDGLFMIEPYQPGKIPVVLVHGLLSDPMTWANLTNELRNEPCLNDRYQWWGYHYATGEVFLKSAAVLRSQLAQIRQTYDPERRDPALSQIVLIGHSMGGLVAKLQVTHSGDHLWRSVAKGPFTDLRLPKREKNFSTSSSSSDLPRT